MKIRVCRSLELRTDPVEKPIYGVRFIILLYLPHLPQHVNIADWNL